MLWLDKKFRLQTMHFQLYIYIYINIGFVIKSQKTINTMKPNQPKPLILLARLFLDLFYKKEWQSNCRRVCMTE